MFRLILLTAPSVIPDEPRILTDLLAQGVERLHLRKPGLPASQLAALIQALPVRYYPLLVLHAYPHLVRHYQLGGLHLTGSQRAATRRPVLLPGQMLSTSYHSLSEISQHRRHYDYVFLSPIFDSISKEGYSSGFNLLEVQARLRILAARPGYRPQVLALGGIEAQNIELVQQAGFAGAAVLGTIWQSADPVAAWRQLQSRVGGRNYANAASQSFHTGS